MLQFGAFLPPLLAEAHVEMHVDWERFALTVAIFLGLAVLGIYLESRGAQKKK